MTRLTRARWTFAIFAGAFAVFAVASAVKGEDAASVAANAIAAAVLGGIWYFLGWLELRR
jgi:hypothetical protein